VAIVREQLIVAMGKEQAESILPPEVHPEMARPDPESTNPAGLEPAASAWLPFSTAKPPARAVVSLPAFLEVKIYSGCTSRTVLLGINLPIE